MSWRDSIGLIIDTAEVCDFYTQDHHLISINKQGTLCFNRGGMWHPNEERENRYTRVDLDSIIQKLSDAGLEPLIRTWRAFSIHSHHFLEYLDRLGILNKITYLAYTDPLVSLPLKYILKMTNLQCLIIDTSKTEIFYRPIREQQIAYQTSLEELVVQLPFTLKILFIKYAVFNGSLANLPPGLQILCINSYQFQQSLDYLPIGLEALLIVRASTYHYNVENLPQGLKLLGLDFDEHRYNGSVILPKTLEYLYLKHRSLDKLLSAIGEYNATNISNVKTFIVNWIFTEQHKATGNLKNMIIKCTNAIHYSNIIKEFLNCIAKGE